MNTNQIPNLGRILEIDYLALLSLLAPVVLWAGYLFLTVDEPRALPVMQVVALAVTAVAVPVLALRAFSIRALFEEGQVVDGQVEQIRFYRDRGRVTFCYTWLGETFHTSSLLHKGKRTITLQPGQPVRVVLDPNKPKRAMIYDLYV